MARPHFRFLVVAQSTVDGQTYYYTGRAGSCWTSTDKQQAFPYNSREAADAKAQVFNRLAELHRLVFSSERVDPWVVGCVGVAIVPVGARQ
jgi:hypothetical protein